ncbi:MAG: cation acetate symporter [Bacteroidetes bacterium GWF2_43_63]|nr:MAG: cation acetate symporter [Bacteroidetes bacterium GWE2_42_42]OFY54277.1 MAG: cation acetate symporter [Bacteroidetes bacterium GWF2_43_63]HBG69328.1 cation acetate symporter [Bacteroidales bacterium]HCB60381.1 cation acetate symporter [Bacteroidales bacterium]HCY23632.1 cation acetate symporter [Bacteroidales bacterium]
MIYEVSTTAIIIFLIFVASVLSLSFYFGRKAKSASGYYAAGGNIHWFVNGIAFAGDYLSAASFLGICGMIAFFGYDGFLYSVGYLAGWVVALFLVAEPLKRLGKYTFADALDAKFNSPAIKLTAAISTLVVSLFYLIPQMVGAGVLVTPLLGFPHWVGVVLVGSIVILIVATAGMTSTTYVQFIKGGLLIIFSIIVVFYVLNVGLKTKPSADYHNFVTLPVEMQDGKVTALSDNSYKILAQHDEKDMSFVKLEKNGFVNWWKVNTKGEKPVLEEALSIIVSPDGKKLYNGAPKEDRRFFQVGHIKKLVYKGKEVQETGPLSPLAFIKTIEESEIVRFPKKAFNDGNDKVTVFYQVVTSGKDIVKPGLFYKLDEGASFWTRLDFLSLMLALFLGTSALPHILIRYYTVPSQRAARKSTVVAIAAIGLFYMLTLYMGSGAMVNGGLDVDNSNMSAPLLAKTFGITIFAIISAIAFATILGTVSGLIVAASGAVAHDLMDKYMNRQMTEKQKVQAGRIVAVIVGIIAIVLGIVFQKQNVNFLVGLAFAIAASANLPAILMLLFWKKTTAKGISWAIVVGMVTALGIILLSPTMYEIYGLPKENAPIPLANPGIFSIPLGFLTLIVVSLASRKKKIQADA